MNKDLSIDEFDALEQISRLTRQVKPTACVNRNAKRLCGIKLSSFRKDGLLELTDEGRAVLFAKHCIEGLRAISTDGNAQLGPEVYAFLSKKSYIAAQDNLVQITARGLECLADIDSQRK